MFDVGSVVTVSCTGYEGIYCQYGFCFGEVFKCTGNTVDIWWWFCCNFILHGF